MPSQWKIETFVQKYLNYKRRATCISYQNNVTENKPDQKCFFDWIHVNIKEKSFLIQIKSEMTGQRRHMTTWVYWIKNWTLVYFLHFQNFFQSVLSSQYSFLRNRLVTQNNCLIWNSNLEIELSWILSPYLCITKVV